MTRPLLEVADIVRAQGNRFIRTSCRWIHWSHGKVLLAIARCRTAALGGHRDQCPRCGYRALSFNSCRNRHRPKCQSGARDRWVAARQSELRREHAKLWGGVSSGDEMDSEAGR
jgi:Transposase zinc-binding domain